MAVRFDASGDSMSRTTNLPGITSFSILAWVNIAVDRDAFTSFVAFGHATGSVTYFMGTGGDGTTFALYNGSATELGSALSVGTWVHVAMTVAGTGANQFLGYLDGVLNITYDGDPSPAADRLWFGNDNDSEFLNGRLAAVKVYSAVLTAAEIALEMRQVLPVRTANLNGFYPMFSTDDDQVDFSGNGNTMTVGGTLATEDGPPIPWKTGRRRPLLRSAAVGRTFVLARV